MKTTTLKQALDAVLTFAVSDSEAKPIQMQALELILLQRSSTVVACQLRLQVEWNTYQQITAQSLLNLKPEVRGSLSGEAFVPERSVEITANLQPELLPQLASYGQDVAALAQHFVQSSESLSHDPLLVASNWFVLKVEQQQESQKSGYRTFWYYLKITNNTPKMMEKGSFLQATLKFMQDRKDLDLKMFGQAISEELAPEVATEITQAILEEFQKELGVSLTPDLASLLSQSFLQEFAQESSSSQPDLTSLVADRLEALLTQEVQAAVGPDGELSETVLSSKGRLFETALSFFAEEGWTIYPLKKETTFGLIYQGQHQEFICYVQVYEEQEQLIFYSICPIRSTEAKRLAMAEFLTRLNFGLLIGNFELDFSNGQIRYKTSIDVEGDRLSAALLKQLVSANVNTMEQFLLPITKVEQEDISPEHALELA